MSASGHEPPFPWRRRTYPVGDVPYVDVHGWLVPWATPGLKTLEELRDLPIVVVTAERGSGKTYALLAEAEAVGGRYVHLPDLADDTVEQLQAAADELGGDGVWHLLLDSYDEALAVDGDLPRRLGRWLSGLEPKARGGLRLRIAARPGPLAQDAVLLRALHSGWPEAPIQVRELAHLTAEEVGIAARHHGLDPAAFLSQVNRRRLQPLASIPVTLTMLLDQGEQDLPGTVSEAFEQACRHWCEETNEYRDAPRDVDVLQLLAAAQRLAAALHLCTTQQSVTTAPGGARAGDLPVSELAHGEEDGYALNEEVLRTLLQSGLVTSLGERRWRFAHRSIQEFLTSRFLRQHGIDDASLRTLLIAGAGRERHAVSAMRDLAGWVAGWNDSVFEDLLLHDPFALVQSDLAARPRPDADRGRLVDALIERIVADYPATVTPIVSSLYRLDHAGLADRLGPHLRVPAGGDAGLADPRLSAAILIAQSAVPNHRPTGALVDVAVAATVHPGLRAAALRSVGPLSPGQVDALKKLLSPTQPPQVAAAALQALRRADLTVAELLEHGGRLAPDNLPGLLPEGDEGVKIVVEVLGWATEQVTGRPVLDSSPGRVREGQRAETERRIHAAAQATGWALRTVAGDDRDSGELAALAEPFAKVFAALVSVDRLWDYAPTGFPDALEEPIADDALRRDVAARVLPLLDKETMPLALDGPLHLFPPQDRLYWAQRFAGAEEPARTGLSMILGRHVILGEAELASAKDLAAGNADVAALIEGWWTPPAAGSDADRWRQRDEARKAAERDQWRFDPAVTEGLLAQPPATATADEVRQWWYLVSHSFAFRTPDGERPGEAFTDLLDLRRTPCCPEPGSALRGAVEEAAARALAASPPVGPGDITAGGFLALESAPEVRALSLLSSPPDLGEERWAGLALVLMSAQVSPEDVPLRTSLLVRAVAGAGDALGRMLPEALGRLGAEHVLPIAIANLVEAAPELAVSLASLLPDLDDDHWAGAVQVLAGLRVDQALLQARTALAGPAVPAGGGASVRWLAAADVLLQRGTAEDRAQIWPVLLSDPALALAWARGTQTWDLAPLAGLTPQQLGRLYDVLIDGGFLNPARGDSQRNSFVWHGAQLETLPEMIATWHVTSDGQDELQRLTQAHPGHPSLARLTRDHALLVAEADWERPSWPELHRLATDTDARLVHTASQLADIVVDALHEIQKTLTGPNGLAALLWNRVTDKHNPTRKLKKGDAAPLWAWWPAWEQDLSDLVARLLTDRLAGHHVVVNREVQLDREGRTDIVLQAPHPTDPGAEPITVIIEAKGCWNPQLSTSLQDQLTRHYLARHGSAAGIYLVGFFDSDFWTLGGHPKLDTKEKHKEKDGRLHARHTRADLLQEQQRLADKTASKGGYDVRVHVLDCRPDAVTALRDEDD